MYRSKRAFSAFVFCISNVFFFFCPPVVCSRKVCRWYTASLDLCGNTVNVAFRRRTRSKSMPKRYNNNNRWRGMAARKFYSGFAVRSTKMCESNLIVYAFPDPDWNILVQTCTFVLEKYHVWREKKKFIGDFLDIFSDRSTDFQRLKDRQYRRLNTFTNRLYW